MQFVVQSASHARDMRSSEPDDEDFDVAPSRGATASASDSCASSASACIAEHRAAHPLRYHAPAAVMQRRQYNVMCKQNAIP